MDHFYQNTRDYSAFESSTDRRELYSKAIDALKEIASKRPLRILELGAGRTAFPQYLESLQIPVEFHAQDVTPANLEYLRPLCKTIHICDITEIRSDPFDLVLSSYVFEHVSAPRFFLEEIDRLLAPGGWHVLVCPRYDMPGYLCPSLRDRSLWQRLGLHVFLFGSRLRTLFDRRPRFWVNTRPSVLTTRWYRDSDAIHIASLIDVKAWNHNRGYKITTIPAISRSWREWIMNRFLTIRVACQKPRT